MSQFIKHSFTMFRGAALGQIIPVALLPVVSRLYGPEAYGIFAGILAVASILAAGAAWRLEVAIVLPEDEDEAARIGRTAFRIAALGMCAALLIFAVFQPVLVRVLGMPDIGYWLCAAPALAFLMTLTQIGGYAATRGREYGAIAASTVGVQAVNAGVAIGLGLAGAGATGLAAARLLGQGAGVARLRAHLRGITGAVAMGPVLAKYKKFPLFNMPYSLIGTFTREFLILALTAFHHPAAAGFYGMARAAMLLPVSLVATSLGQVFYREAARSIDDPRFRDFAFMLMLAAGGLAAIVLSVFTLWDAQVFAIAFGQAWEGAGVYATLFAPVAVLFMMTSWPERVFEVRGRQDIPLMLQIVFDGAAVAAVVLALRHGYAPLEAVAIFVGIQCLYHLTYIAFVFRCLGIGAGRYAGLAAAIAASGAAPYVMHMILSPLMGETLVLFVLETAIFGLACLGGLWIAIRRIAASAAFLGNSPKAG